MNVGKYKSDDILKEVHQAIINQYEGVKYSILDNGVTFVPRQGVVDEVLCYELGYKVYEAMYIAGVIVGNQGDIDIAYFGKPENKFYLNFIDYFIDWLKSKGLKAEFVDNDILVDGYKVCGIAVTRHTPVEYTAAHIGINTNLDHIKAICKKPMKKVPKGLSEYGITTEEVEQMFLGFCEQYQQ